MLGGLPTIYGINPFTTSTVPEHQLGAIGVTPDGRKFRYARVDASTALVAGNLLQSKAENTSDQDLAFAAAAIGATEIVTTTTVTVDANEYADGYVAVTVTPDLGHYYRIKSHPAASAATLTLQLYDPLEVAWTTSTRADLVANPYNRVIQHPTTATSAVVGVAVQAAAVDTYTWIQSGGPCAMLTEGVIAVGQQVVASNGTAGAVEDVASTTQQIVGRAMSGIASGENGMIFLTLD